MRSLGPRLALGCGLVVFYLGRVPQHPPEPLEPGRPVVVPVRGGLAAFELEFAAPDEHFLLIVGSLAREAEPTTIELVERSVEAAAPQRLEPLPRLPTPVRGPALPMAPPRVRSASPTPTRQFWLPLGEGSSDNPAGYRPITARLCAQSAHLAVYVDQADRVDHATLETLLALYQRRLRPRLAPVLGEVADIDGDGRLTVVLTGWLSRLRGGRTSLGGMVRPADFRRTRPGPFSNGADVIFLNANLRPGRHLETVFAHELAHAIAAGARHSVAFPWGAADESAWLNEGLAHVAEDLHGAGWSNLDHRLAAYLADTASSPLCFDRTVAAAADDPGTRGASFLFLRWCVDRFGPELLARLTYTTLRDRANLEQATGAEFGELFRRYSIDLYLESSGLAPSTAPAPAGLAGGGGRQPSDREVRLAALDLAAPLGDWGLAGPRAASWQLGAADRSRTCVLGGTAVQYYLLSAPTAGAWRIELSGQSAAAWQVTLVPLGRALPKLELFATDDDPDGCRVELRHAGGPALRLRHIGWQADRLATPALREAPHGCLREAELGRMLGSAADDPLVVKRGQSAEVRLVRQRLPRGPTLISVVAFDDAGRKATAWARLDLGTRADPLAVAEHRSRGEAIHQ